MRYVSGSPLTRLGLAYFFLQLQFWFPIWIIFLLDRGFSLTQVVIADVVYHAAVVIFEVPAGMVGDKLGRKLTYMIGAVIASITYLLMILITEFSLILLCWFSWSLFVTIISGTDTAYIFELYRQSTGNTDSGGIYGRFAAIAAFASLISHFLAGLLYAIDIRLPILINAIMALFAVPIIASLPKVEENLVQSIKVTTFKEVVADLRTTQFPVWLILLSFGIIHMYQYTTTLLLQPFLNEAAVPIVNFGIIYGISTSLAIIVGLLVGYAIRRFGGFNMVAIGMLLFLLSTGVMGIFSPTLGVVGLITLRPIYTIVESPVKSMINVRVEDFKRASLFSFANLFSSLLMMISRPILGIIMVQQTTKFAFFIWFISGFIIIPITLILLKIGLNRSATIPGL